MHRKYNALDKFIELKAELENQLGKRIKALQYEGSNTPMGPSGPRSKFIYHDDTVYEGWIGSWFILVHKGVLVIM